MARRHRNALGLGLAVLAFVGLAAACDDSIAGPPSVDDEDLRPGFALLGEEWDLSLRAEAPAFEPGGKVTLALENGTQSDVGYNLCFHGIEERSGDEWHLLEASRVCTTVLHILGPGDTVHYDTTLPESLEPGEYRFRAALHLLDEGDFRDQVTEPFRVEG